MTNWLPYVMNGLNCSWFVKFCTQISFLYSKLLHKFPHFSKFMQKFLKFRAQTFPFVLILCTISYINPKQARGGGSGICPQAGSSLCCAETVSSRKLKLSDFYYILIGLNFEYKPVPWDIHCCHGNAIVENCILLFKSFSNLSLGLLFVISISKLPPIPNFNQIR